MKKFYVKVDADIILSCDVVVLSGGSTVYFFGYDNCGEDIFEENN